MTAGDSLILRCKIGVWNNVQEVYDLILDLIVAHPVRLDGLWFESDQVEIRLSARGTCTIDLTGTSAFLVYGR
jgi:hypothetical protein